MTRQHLRNVVIFLLLGFIINVCVAFFIGRKVEWPGMGQIQIRGNVMPDADVQRLWTIYSKYPQARGIENPPPHIQGKPDWMFRGWRVREFGTTFIGFGNGYVPTTTGPVGAWRADDDSVVIALIEIGWPLQTLRHYDIEVSKPRLLMKVKYAFVIGCNRRG